MLDTLSDEKVIEIENRLTDVAALIRSGNYKDEVFNLLGHIEHIVQRQLLIRRKALKYVRKKLLDYGDLNQKAEEEVGKAFIDGANDWENDHPLTAMQALEFGLAVAYHGKELNVIEYFKDHLHVDITGGVYLGHLKRFNT